MAVRVLARRAVDPVIRTTVCAWAMLTHAITREPAIKVFNVFIVLVVICCSSVSWLLGLVDLVFGFGSSAVGDGFVLTRFNFDLFVKGFLRGFLVRILFNCYAARHGLTGTVIDIGVYEEELVG